MKSLKIDLTERHDFVNTSNVANPLFHLGYIIEYKMSREEYDLWVLRQRFFGKKLYENHKWAVFGDQRLEKEMEEHCERCGKRITPWEKATHYGLCEECDEIMTIGDVFPWNPIIKERENNIEYNLFNLR